MLFCIITLIFVHKFTIMKKIFYSFYLTLLGLFPLTAQDVDTRSSFIITGFSINIPKQHQLTVYRGLSTEKHVHLLMLMSNFKINKTIAFTPSYIFMDSPLGHSKELKQHQFNALVTLSFPLDKQGKWILQTRNGYLHKSIEGGIKEDFYRGRLGVLHKTQIFDKKLNIFAHKEFYVNFKNGNLTRQRIYLGVDFKLLDWLNPQFFYIYQGNQGNLGHDHLLLVGAIIPLENYGFFKSKNSKK